MEDTLARVCEKGADYTNRKEYKSKCYKFIGDWCTFHIRSSQKNREVPDASQNAGDNECTI